MTAECGHSKRCECELGRSAGDSSLLPYSRTKKTTGACVDVRGTERGVGETVKILRRRHAKGMSSTNTGFKHGRPCVLPRFAGLSQLETLIISRDYHIRDCHISGLVSCNYTHPMARFLRTSPLLLLTGRCLKCLPNMMPSASIALSSVQTVVGFGVITSPAAVEFGSTPTATTRLKRSQAKVRTRR